MKFEKQRISGLSSNKIDLTAQQFLTFRTNAQAENTGRTVYSQQFDYRSLEKYNQEEPHEQGRYNFRKNMRNVRSQDKYRLICQEANSSQFDQNGESPVTGDKQKNQQLKGRVSLLVKSIKRAQKKANTIDEQIMSLETVIQQNSQQLHKQKTGISQLTEIADQNILHCNEMILNIKQLEQRARELTQQCGLLDNELQNGVYTGRSKDSGSNCSQINIKLNGGIKELEKMGGQMDKKIEYFEMEIEKMQRQLETLHEIDCRVRTIGTMA